MCCDSKCWRNPSIRSVVWFACHAIGVVKIQTVHAGQGHFLSHYARCAISVGGQTDWKQLSSDDVALMPFAVTSGSFSSEAGSCKVQESGLPPCLRPQNGALGPQGCAHNVVRAVALQMCIRWARCVDTRYDRAWTIDGEVSIGTVGGQRQQLRGRDVDASKPTAAPRTSRVSPRSERAVAMLAFEPFKAKPVIAPIVW